MSDPTVGSDEGGRVEDESNWAPASLASMSSEFSVSPKVIRRAPGFAIVLYGLLALSATVALLGRSSHFLPDVAKLAAPIAFAAFFIFFVLYRLALVRSRRYAPAKAFVQIGIGALFLLMLAPGVMKLRPNPAALEPAWRLMHHKDPSVRALACDAFGQLSVSEANEVLSVLEGLIDDPHPGVRERAQRALENFDLRTKAQSPGSASSSDPPETIMPLVQEKL